MEFVGNLRVQGVQVSDSRTSFSGINRFTPPELLREKGSMDQRKAGDVWSLGVILLECLT